jgi:hypothetical protein
VCYPEYLTTYRRLLQAWTWNLKHEVDMALLTLIVTYQGCPFYQHNYTTNDLIKTALCFDIYCAFCGNSVHVQCILF